MRYFLLLLLPLMGCHKTSPENDYLHSMDVSCYSGSQLVFHADCAQGGKDANGDYVFTLCGDSEGDTGKKITVAASAVCIQ